MFRVADLHALLEALRAEGCAVQDKVEESEFGKFGWVLDPEGNKLELWEPPGGQQGPVARIGGRQKQGCLTGPAAYSPITFAPRRISASASAEKRKALR